MSHPSLLRATHHVLKRELIIALRRSTDILTPWIFFVIVITLFPLGVGPEAGILRTIAPGIVWVAALLASMLSLGHLFSGDFEDGSLEQLILAPHPLTVLVLTKVFAHWLLSGLPLVLLAPLLALQLGLPADATYTLAMVLLLGTPILGLVGSVGAALTVGLRGGGVLVSLLVLPLYTPVLIFGAGAVTAVMGGFSAEAHISILAALLALAITFCPWATAAALRVSLD